MTSQAPLFLNAETVRACLPPDIVLRLVGDTLKGLGSGGMVNGPKTGFEFGRGAGHLHLGSVSGGVLASNAVGIKWFAVAAANRERNLPRVPATILVCDAETGLLDGVLDGTHLTADRTAAMAVCAAFACAGNRARNVAVVGAGAIGKALVQYLAATGTVDAISIVVPDRPQAHSVPALKEIRGAMRVDLDLSITSNVRDAVSGADVVFTATGVGEDSDLVRAAWLKDDAVVCSLGSRREVDLDLISNSWVVVDDPAGVRLRRKDFQEDGVGWNRVAADLGSIMSGAIELPPMPRRVHLVLVGLGVLDVALGAQALAIARREGLGVRLR